jgi:tRNA(fMet)-specific endonuclease VapC
MSPMLILDTDHLSEMERGSPGGTVLEVKLIRSGDIVVSTIISAEEQLRGWLAQISRRDVHDQVDPYRRLQGRLAFYAQWTLLPWSSGAADRYIILRKNKVRIGPMDLKIASIALECGGKVLSQNLADFGKVPGLRVESWL